jgi:hypothetical protein
MDDDMVPLTGEVLPDWIFGSILHSLGRARRGLGMMESTGEGNSDLWRRGNLFLLDWGYLKHLVILLECRAIASEASISRAALVGGLV